MEMDNTYDATDLDNLPYTTLRVHDTGAMADQIRIQGRELMILKDTVNSEIQRLREENLDLRKRLEKRKREEEEDIPCQVDDTQTKTCLVCKKTKELRYFQITEKRKNKFGVIIVYVKTRKTCKACYSRKTRENKKARK